jgi:hypothetical protein
VKKRLKEFTVVGNSASGKDFWMEEEFACFFKTADVIFVILVFNNGFVKIYFFCHVTAFR